MYERRKKPWVLPGYIKWWIPAAAEFEAKTPYFYSTFENKAATANKLVSNESKLSDKKKIIVLGSGPNRIGQGIEFDYCCVHGLLAIKEAGL